MAMDEFDESPPASRPKLSKAPSWIMLGFLLGAIFVAAMNRRPSPAVATAPAPIPPPRVVAPAALPPRQTDVEAYFEEWRKYAIWTGDDRTYIVAYDVPSATYRDAFEVLRVGDKYYFRGIPRPRGMRVLEGVPHNSPLQLLNPIAEEPRGMFGAPVTPAPATSGTP